MPQCVWRQREGAQLCMPAVFSVDGLEAAHTILLACTGRRRCPDSAFGCFACACSAAHALQHTLC